jgi:CBS domain-containing protein
MNVRDVMTARPRCAAPDTPLSHLAELMQADDIGAIPILDRDRLVGMVTDRDIVVRAVANDAPRAAAAVAHAAAPHPL